MTKRFLSVVLPLAALIFIGCAGIAAAESYRTVDDAAPQEIVDGMANKLVRGVANVGTGWLEIPKQIVLTYREDGAVKGATVGPLKGIGMTVVRTVAGAAEAVTFFLPYPGFFEPFFDPAYVWQKE